MNDGEPNDESRRSRLAEIVDFAAELSPDFESGPILEGLRRADRAIQDAAGAAARGTGELLVKAVSTAADAAGSVDVGAVAGAAADVLTSVVSNSAEAAGPILEATASAAGDVLVAVLESAGDAISS